MSGLLYAGWVTLVLLFRIKCKIIKDAASLPKFMLNGCAHKSNQLIITGPPNGPVSFCTLSSSSVMLPASGPDSCRARGWSVYWRPGIRAADTAVRLHDVPLGRRLV